MSTSHCLVSPIDQKIIYRYQESSPKHIQEALTQGERAQKKWQNTCLNERAQQCQAFIEEVMKEHKKLSLELTQQMGRPIIHSPNELKGFEERANHMIKIAPQCLKDIILPEEKKLKRKIVRHPLGCVLIISPWNYPYLTTVNALIPALMAGNNVILKHASQTLLVGKQLEKAAERAGLEKGLFSHLILSHQQTQDIIQSGKIQRVNFTGSVQAGNKIEQFCAGQALPLGLELGGKDPAYIRQDAPIDVSAQGVVEAALFNSGQGCCSIERVYVHQSRWDDFMHQAIQKVKKYRLGNPLDPQTTLGPMASLSAAQKVRKQMEQACKQGAISHISTDFFPENDDHTPYLAPQILTQVSHDMDIMKYETFGPLMGVMPVQDDQQAIDLMNDSDYGLTACVWTQDLERAKWIGQHIQTGTFFANRADYLDPSLPWGGVKKTGKGATLSQIGYEYMTRPKSYYFASL